MGIHREEGQKKAETVGRQHKVSPEEIVAGYLRDQERVGPGEILRVSPAHFPVAMGPSAYAVKPYRYIFVPPVSNKVLWNQKKKMGRKTGPNMDSGRGQTGWYLEESVLGTR